MASHRPEVVEKTQFSYCLSCVEDKHCLLKKPKKSGALYHNYKGTFSIVLLALCDARYRFIFIAIGSYGHNNDAGIYDSSAPDNPLKNGTLNLPPHSTLPGTQPLTPHVVVGDGAFPLKTYLMKPFAGQNLPPENDIFNYRLSRCRLLIENTFGICSKMWRVLLNPFETSINNAEASIKAICALHNFLNAEENANFSLVTLADRGEEKNGVWRIQLAMLRQPENIRSTEAHNYVVGEKCSGQFHSPLPGGRCCRLAEQKTKCCCSLSCGLIVCLFIVR